jgi:hypothetical protein
MGSQIFDLFEPTSDYAQLVVTRPKRGVGIRWICKAGGGKEESPALHVYVSAGKE